ncbi:MAG: glycosyltransferase family 2 protein [Candidatus Magasanikbacteria bacterium]|nr:glycosyltransferase family 2 protein [Candidatus Magasanikbacteria bacterium]
MSSAPTPSPRPPRRRTLADRLICGARAGYYALAEPPRLRLARFRYGRRYQNRQARPLISIMMPTYQRGKLLVERTLPPIFAQTYQNFEIVIVGDCTADDTAELLAKITDPRLRFYNLPRRSKYPADTKSRWFVGGVPPRNVGLSLCRGDWIAELDDDDIFFPDHLEVLLRYAQENNYELVSASYIAERYGKRSVVDVRDVAPRVGGIETWLYRSYLRFFRYNIDSWRKSYNCPQEIDRQIRMYRAGVRIGFLDQPVALVLPLPGAETVGLDALAIKTGEQLR